MARTKKMLARLRPHWRALRLTIIGGSVVVCVAGVPATGQASQLSGTCGNQIVRDYERPLRRMPANRRPAGGRLSFTPSGIGLAKLGSREVFIRGDMIGYRLIVNRAKNRVGRLRRPLDLRWDVESTLTAVDAHGRPVRIVAHQQKRLGEVRSPEHVEFGLRVNPASIASIPTLGTGMARCSVSIDSMCELCHLRCTWT
jgi:hypothetical protein